MAKIRQLDPHVADLIAAGEVVERPGSVVKELIENSIDAGADALTVEIKNGGMSYIRVSDNGCGMSPEDAKTAFLRHATSKLRDERGLEAIGTLGFRGEALAAIAAVSRVELLTREPGAAEGVSLTLEAGEITEELPAGCPEGTTIVVRELFFNTPARLKYMKKDSAEGAAVSAAVIRCALSHPEVSIRYIKDGTEEAHTPGDGSMEACIYSIFGQAFSKGLLEAKSEDEEISVSGLVTAPAVSRGNRGWQFFFVNGRCVKSKLLQAALEQAYKNSLFTGKFPGCVLYIKMKLSAVDVNVHPAKTEVRFLNERAVFDAVYYAVLSALEKEKGPHELPLPPEKVMRAQNVKKAEPKKDFFKTMPALQLQQKAAKPQESLPLSRGKQMFRYETSAPAAPAKAPERRSEEPAAKERETREEPVQQRLAEVEKAEDFRIIGEALDTYILVEKGEAIIIIDKHAAHERMIFDRLRAGEDLSASQFLLTPLVCELGAEAAQALLAEKEQLEALGFEISEFGAGAVALRRLPSDINRDDAEEILAEAAESLMAGGKVQNAHDELLHSVACRAAIKAGKRSSPEELKYIAAEVISGRVKYCPHGRPVSMELGKTALDKGFKRI